ncbi:MAG: SMC-Scp complex subunit ScpB, partial [Oscillospiraceae bacterium]|nr:SMC-Scp complex subunit ScpB [Oscillospiraceae bacterium]
QKLAEETRVSFNAANRGVQIVRIEDSYQMCSTPAYARQVRALLEIRHNAPLSQAALEVLAIIAYNQPVTKAFIEQIRGVDSSSTVGSLCQKGLVEERGRLELPGRPLLYGTTLNFLRCMGISSIEEMPPLRHDEPAEKKAGVPAEAEA